MILKYWRQLIDWKLNKSEWPNMTTLNNTVAATRLVQMSDEICVRWDLQPNKQSAHHFCADPQQKMASIRVIQSQLPSRTSPWQQPMLLLSSHNTAHKHLRIAIVTFVVGGICSVRDEWQICTTTTTHHPCKNPYPSVLTHLSSYANFVFCTRTGEYNILLHHQDSTPVDHWSWLVNQTTGYHWWRARTNAQHISKY